MMIYTNSLPSPVSQISVDEEKLMINLADGSAIHLIDAHEADCCEMVYIDWETVSLHLPQIDYSIKADKLTIKVIEQEGLLLTFSASDDDYFNLYCSGHNIQNGYYSNNLTLVVKQFDPSGVETGQTSLDIIDATAFTEADQNG
jgi:hypothetical protein